MFVQCEDDPNFESTHGDACLAFSAQRELCSASSGANSEGVSASEACPISCGTGCALTFDSCWNQQETCQNGGVCVNLPGVEAFGCDCTPHYTGPTCETYCGPEQECVRLAEHICATLSHINIMTLWIVT